MTRAAAGRTNQLIFALRSERSPVMCPAGVLMKWSPLAVVGTLFVAMATAGCGTLNNQSDRNQFELSAVHTSNRAYGGVRFDSEMVARYYGRVRDDPDFNPPLEGQAGLWAYVLFDVPLSLAADTMLLPYDLWATATGRATTKSGLPTDERGLSNSKSPSWSPIERMDLNAVENRIVIRSPEAKAAAVQPAFWPPY